LRKEVVAIKTITIRLDDALHKRLKILSATLGKSIHEIFIEYLKKLLEENHIAE